MIRPHWSAPPMLPSRPPRPLVPALVLGLVLAGCGGGTSSPSAEASAPEPPESVAASVAASVEASAAPSEPEEASVRVRLTGFSFDTDELTIAAGTEVTFLNADRAGHTVTEGRDGVAVADPVINLELAANQADSFVFDEPGTYEITCLIHPSMNMTVIVEG
jgi:plastocyanin